MKRTSCEGSSVSLKPKKRRTGTGKSKKLDTASEWPEYFVTLEKCFIALNTVLAFCSSRKHIATTFNAIRSPVENLLRRPLDMSQVAEIKALLPELVNFAYIPQGALRADSESSSRKQKNKAENVDFNLSSKWDDEEHVLVLDFEDNIRGVPNANVGVSYLHPPSLSVAGTKKLIERRNESFRAAVNELLEACAFSSEDALQLLEHARQEHIPVNPSDSRPGPSKLKASSERLSLDQFVEELMQQDWYRDQIVHRRHGVATQGKYSSFSLSSPVAEALRSSRGVTSLYSHQAEAIAALQDFAPKNVIVATSTASGKSVIYQAPLLQLLLEDRHARAIFVYPTKALAQDQRAALEGVLSRCPGLEQIEVSTYDGDTPKETRSKIREQSSVIFTNFDMIHATILPHEEQWRSFFQHTKLFVVDELHYYSGVFGTHVAMIMRRFRRVCAAVGNADIRFVSCSATIAQPKQHMMNIFGVADAVEVTEDGAPTPRKDFIVWNPPLMVPADPSAGRSSALDEATRLMANLIQSGWKVITFCKSRKVCELAMKSMRALLSSEGRYDLVDKVVSYRSGYSQEDRRRIEADAFSGRLLGIIATNALELGVDIGVLDAVIMLSFPFSIASLRQQVGRAGRRARDSLAVLVTDNLPLDQHYANNPEELFEKITDELVIDVENPFVLEAHLQCAADELPLTLQDEVYFGPLTKGLLESKLSKDDEGWYFTNPKYLPYPAKHISIRGAREETYTVVEIKHGVAQSIVEEVEISRALFELYEGGVFIHQGYTYIVKEMRHETKVAKVIQQDVDWITSPRDFTNVDAVETYRIREIQDSPHHAFYGRVEVYTKVFGFFKIRKRQILEAVDVDSEPWERETTGMWIDVPRPLLIILQTKGINPAECIHSAQHAYLNQTVMASELRTECKAPQKEYKITESNRKRPARLIFYDMVGKGSGVAAKAFDHVSTILRKALDAIEGCDCEEGCGKCIQSPSCPEKNTVYSKAGALVIIRGILGLAIDESSLPQGSDCESEDLRTVVPAVEVKALEGVQVEKSIAIEKVK